MSKKTKTTPTTLSLHFITYCNEKFTFRHATDRIFMISRHGGGDTASSFAKNHLMNYIVDEPGFYSSNDQEVLQAIKKGFLECHLAMWKDLGEFLFIVLIRIQYENLERDFSFRPVASGRLSKM